MASEFFDQLAAHPPRPQRFIPTDAEDKRRIYDMQWPDVEVPTEEQLRIMTYRNTAKCKTLSLYASRDDGDWELQKLRNMLERLQLEGPNPIWDTMLDDYRDFWSPDWVDTELALRRLEAKMELNMQELRDMTGGN